MLSKSLLASLLVASLAALCRADAPQLWKPNGGTTVCTRRTKDNDKLTMHYRGTLQDGTQFDSR